MRSAGSYSLASALAQGVSLCAALLARRFLGPSQSGVWAVFQVVLGYSNYSTLGVTEAVTREIPFYLGKNDPVRCDAIKNQVFSFVLLTSILVAGGLVVYALSLRGGVSSEIFYGLLGTSALVLLNRFNNLLIALLRAYMYFDVASRQAVAASLINAVLMATLSYHFRIYGFMWAMGLSFVFNILFILGHRKFTFRICFDANRIKELILFGAPLMSIGFINTIFLSADKIMIGRYLGLAELGLYGLAFMGAQYLGTFPNSVAIVLVSHLHKRFASRQTAESLKDHLQGAVLLFSSMMPCLIALAFFLMPYIIISYLPSFQSCIPAARTLLLCSFFSAIQQPYSDFSVAVRDNRQLLVLYAVFCPVVFALDWLAIRGGFGIAGVAIATFAAVYMRFVAGFVLAERRFGSLRASTILFARIHGKFLWMAFCLFLLERAVPGDASESLMGPLLRSAIFITFCLPPLWRLIHRLGLFGK